MMDKWKKIARWNGRTKEAEPRDGEWKCVWKRVTNTKCVREKVVSKNQWEIKIVRESQREREGGERKRERERE